VSPKNQPHFLRIYILGVPHTDTHTLFKEQEMNEKDKYTDKLITAMVFHAEDTNGLVIHLNGFESQEHANKFCKKLMKNSGIEYKSIRELFDLPTIH
tara:strand:+ start:362 stop:652 length:291 start_codon:yes stop_codon:yes gene_type:complete